MHTTKTQNTTFIHNGDYSGPTILVVPISKIRSLEGPDKDYAHVEVDFEDLKEFIAIYIRDEKISQLENASNEELLGLPKK